MVAADFAESGQKSKKPEKSSWEKCYAKSDRKSIENWTKRHTEY